MEEERKPLENRNFIDAFIEEDLALGGRFEGKRVHTRFPPEPNGYLHIGHCKALTIDFGTAEKFGGLCNLRMDDTNPTKEDTEYVDAIQADIHWLGFDWGDRFFYGSDYFEKDYEFAVELIKKGLAYVCDLTAEQFKECRGDIGKPAVSPYRDRPVEENLDLFDYYVITPHFPLDAASQKRVLKILTRIPNRKLILVDHWMKELPGNYGAVYQDFANDAYEGLGYGLKKLKTCSRFNVVTLPSSLYYASVGKAVERFCRDNGIAVEFHTEITPEIIREKEVYLILNSQYDLGLIELVRRARERNYRVGRDISIISYNESPINEIILNGLTTISTDFRQMGVLVARMILEKSLSKVKCDFQMIRRNTF